MQPFDLLGITIKSLAEIEKEVSKLPSVGAGGAWVFGARMGGWLSRCGRGEGAVLCEENTAVSLKFIP